MTAIEWTQRPGTKGVTWNPGAGCFPKSEGCAKCYAMRLAARLERMGQAKYRGLTRPTHGTRRLGVWTGEVYAGTDELELPLKWKAPRTVFVNSMSDLFYERFSFEWIAAVFGVMAACPRHTFIVLTKWPERALEFYRWLEERCEHPNHHDYTVQQLAWELLDESGRKRLLHPIKGTIKSWPWPLPNVWLVASCENQARADERIPLLRQCPAAVRGVSLEPLLGPIDLSRWVFSREEAISNAMRGSAALNREQADASIGHPLDWVIVGGESGHDARPCDVGWVRSIVAQCREAGVAVFVKQLGANPSYGDREESPCPSRGDATHCVHWWDGDACCACGDGAMKLRDRKGGDISEWPGDLRVRQWPRAA